MTGPFHCYPNSRARRCPLIDSEEDVRNVTKNKESGRQKARVLENPLTVTGKVQKFRMREISVEELKLEAAAKIETA